MNPTAVSAALPPRPGLMGCATGTLVLSLILGVWAAPAFAQAPPSQAVSLREAVDSAWRRAAVSAEATGQGQRAQAERSAAAALWAAPPALEIAANRDRQRASGYRREAEAGVAIPLWLPGQRRARLEQVEAEVTAAAAAADAARLRVAGAVREAAAEVAAQQAELAAAQSQEHDLDALARDVERRVAAGDLARADALAAHAERLSASAAVGQAKLRVQSAELRWTALTGLHPVPLLDEESPPAAVPAQHPALAAAALKVQEARQRLAVAQASGRDAPELLLRARQETGAGEPAATGIGVALRIPLGTASRNEPRMAAALAELAGAEAAELEQRRLIDAELATARLAQDAARRQLALDTERAALLGERSALVDKSFKMGETPLPDMLRALTAATQAQAAVARARVALAQATSRLHQALGVLP